MNLRWCPLLLILLASGAPLRAELVLHLASGMEVHLPDGWTATSEGELVTASPPEASLELVFFPSNLQVLSRFSDRIEEEVALVIAQAEVSLVDEVGEFNELLHMRAEGFGLYENEIVDWDLHFVTGARRSLVTVILGETEGWQPTLNQIFQSIDVVPPKEIEEEETEGENEEDDGEMEGAEVAPSGP